VDRSLLANLKILRRALTWKITLRVIVSNDKIRPHCQNTEGAHWEIPDFPIGISTHRIPVGTKYVKILFMCFNIVAFNC